MSSAASGSFYEQSVERRIFKPLGMNDASLGLAGIRPARAGRVRTCSRNGWVSLTPKPTTTGSPRRPASMPVPATWRSGCSPTGHRPDVLPAPLLATLHSSSISTPARCVQAGAVSACIRRLCPGLAHLRLRRPRRGVPCRCRTGLPRPGRAGAGTRSGHRHHVERRKQPAQRPAADRARLALTPGAALAGRGHRLRQRQPDGRGQQPCAAAGQAQGQGRLEQPRGGFPR